MQFALWFDNGTVRSRDGGRDTPYSAVTFALRKCVYLKRTYAARHTQIARDMIWRHILQPDTKVSVMYGTPHT